MSIQEIQIKGFRSLRDVTWRPGQLNVIIGRNGSGKSNLLRGMELLKHSARGELAEEIVRQGGIRSILWDRSDQRLSWDISGLGYPMEDVQVKYSLSLSPGGIGAMDFFSNYHINYEKLSTTLRMPPQGDETVYLEFRPPKKPIFHPKFTEAKIGTEFKPNEGESLLSNIGFGLNFVVIGPELSFFQTGLASWKIYQDLRVDQGTDIRKSAVTRHSEYLDSDGQNLVAFLHTNCSSNRDFRNSMNSVLQAVFDDFEELVFAPAEDQRIQLRVAWKSLKDSHSAAELSDGTLRFLLLSAILLAPNPPGLIAIDEPETGLHPRMFEVIAELARDAAERTQVIFTTHSPEFLDGFRSIAPTTTVATCEKGETKLSVVDGTELKRWLKEYSLGSLFRSNELELLA